LGIMDTSIADQNDRWKVLNLIEKLNWPAPGLDLMQLNYEKGYHPTPSMPYKRPLKCQMHTRIPLPPSSQIRQIQNIV
jgi:hypothetical protein